MAKQMTKEETQRPHTYPYGPVSDPVHNQRGGLRTPRTMRVRRRVLAYLYLSRRQHETGYEAGIRSPFDLREEVSNFGELSSLLGLGSKVLR